MKHLLSALCMLLLAPLAAAQSCPDKNVLYWQAFPPGGESDISARHQQVVLKKKCPNIDTVVQYKPGAGGGLMWAQINTLPGDGLNVVGINLPHIVFQPIEGEVQYKTQDITPVFWFHYTPDALVVPDQSPIKSFADFIKAAKADPGKLSLGGSGLNSANHAAHERLDAVFGVKTIYVPYKGTGDMTTAVLGSQIDGAMSVHGIRHQQQGPGAGARRRDGKAPPAAARRAYVPRARRGLGRRRVPRHRRAEEHVARGEEAPVGPVGRAEQRSRNEGARRQERLRADQRRHRPDGCFHEGQDPHLHRGRAGAGPGRK